MIESAVFGKLTLSAIPMSPIILGADIFMALIVVVALFSLTYFKKWSWLWQEWLTTLDHKKIGIMYLILAGVMLVRGFVDAIMMRTQQAVAVGTSAGYLPPEHYDQIFTAHGAILIFLMAMPFLFAFLNFFVPIQIGARDVAFPFLNSISLWLSVIAAILINVSLVVGSFAKVGWLAYPPLSELAFSPGVGMDYYLVALQLAGVGTLMSAINFFVTIARMRCPGMTFMKMPIFVWTALCSVTLMIMIFPILTATFGMLFLDRYMGMHFFTAGHGGNAMMYVNLIWAWGHPEVYVLVLPAFGIYSEVVPTFCRKKLFGYTTMVWASCVITILSFIVWAHHFFTMGAGANVNTFFGIATMIIAIPTGVKIFNWIFTMYKGRITFGTPMMWTLAFISTFAFGGLTGVLISIPPVDFIVHNSLFLVAHFHNTIIGGVVFGYFAGFIYWFPKMFGFKLNERLGKYALWCWVVGFYVTFVPLYALGLMGMTRRLTHTHYTVANGWYTPLIISVIGVAIIALGVVFQVIQLLVSIKNRNKPGYRDTTGDPWIDGRNLEWSTTSPPPFYNFAFLPEVQSKNAFWYEKRDNEARGKKKDKSRFYEPIHMPKNSSVGYIFGIVSFILGFSIIWHVWWLVIVSSLAALLCLVVRAFNYDVDYYVTADEVKCIEERNIEGARV